MAGSSKTAMKERSPYTGVITREQFLFYEMRTTAKLMQEGLSDDEIISKILAQKIYLK